MTVPKGMPVDCVPPPPTRIMNTVDVLILLAVAGAAAYGVAQGAVVQVLSFGGFWIGLIIGAAVAPSLSQLAGTGVGRALATFAALLVIPALLGGVGQQVGVRVLKVVRRARLGKADSALGAVIASLATLAIVWLFALVYASGPSAQLATAIHDSAIARGLVDNLPPAPEVFARIRQLVRQSHLPQVFAQFEPEATEPVALPSDPVVRAALGAAGDSTVRVVGIACSQVKSGSGWIAGPGMVVTNAHVVAGVDEPSVEDAEGRHDATTVLFDPDLDVAILRTNGLEGTPLPLLRTEVERGEQGAILGYPEGGPLRAEPAAVLRRVEAVGRDIYGERLIRRAVYQLQAIVKPGNSGGPFVRSTGEVVGVVFSSSTTEGDIGYALTSEDVSRDLDEVGGRRSPVDTGRCVS
ncbi:MAG: MarP family serine protease [Actinomycetota bacterium]